MGRGLSIPEPIAAHTIWSLTSLQRRLKTGALREIERPESQPIVRYN